MPVVSGGQNPFAGIQELRYDVALPRFFRVRQKFHAHQISDVPGATRAALEPLSDRVYPGMTVAITAGSRGIFDMPEVIRSAGAWLRDAGATPFVVPAMGSHGGATAQGQVEVLQSLGITEHSIGMPILSTMDTVELGATSAGPVARLDRNAAGADAILVVNRIKPHTDFKGHVESGLGKITAIGLGKHAGAEDIHRYGPGRLEQGIIGVAHAIVATGKILGGLAVVENAFDRAAVIELVEPDGIAGPHERRLLALAKDFMGRLPFDELDVAIIDVMGKDKSGVGMDPNVIGRLMVRGSPDLDRPRIANIVVLDISAASHGNAMGVGLADFVPFRVVEKLDLRKTYINAVTGGLGGPQRAQIPMALATDRDAIAAAVLTCGQPDPRACRIVRMPDTLHLEELAVSESMLREVNRHPRLEVVGSAEDLRFDSEGALLGFGPSS